MKKQVAKPATDKKLILSKRTIANLRSSEMSKIVGAGHGHTGGGYNSKECTKNGNTCPGHATC
jgi:hypothetical protein